MLSSSIQIAITYLVLVAVSALFSESSKSLLVWYLVIGIVTFFVYAKDKRAAINGSWRLLNPLSAGENACYIVPMPGGISIKCQDLIAFLCHSLLGDLHRHCKDR